MEKEINRWGYKYTCMRGTGERKFEKLEDKNSGSSDRYILNVPAGQVWCGEFMLFTLNTVYTVYLKVESGRSKDLGCELALAVKFFCNCHSFYRITKVAGCVIVFPACSRGMLQRI